MKCKDCEACCKGFFESKPKAYVCIGVKEPFIIDDINVECTEYPEMSSDTVASVIKVATIAPAESVKAYVGNDGIYVPSDVDFRYYKMLISKELFVEAYNKWIKGEETMINNHLEPCPFCGSDVLDIMYERNECQDKLMINCPHCGEFIIVHDQFRAGKTCYDVWNTRVREVYRYDIHGEDDADDWSE